MSTVKLLVKKQIEETSELEIPAFYRCKATDEAIGVFSEDTVITCFIGINYSSINVNTVDGRQHEITKAVSTWDKISEEEFTTEYKRTLNELVLPKTEVTTAHLNEKYSHAV